MIRLAAPEKTGEYIAVLISQKFKKRSDFCREYLIMEDAEPDKNEIRKMNNRLSQIIKGEKNIQSHDLLSFAMILGVSCEEILTAGEVHNPPPGRLTIYDVARSRRKKVWKEQIKHNYDVMISKDEYNKSLLDYALENNDYKLIRFLYEKGLITELNTKYSIDSFKLGRYSYGISHVFKKFSDYITYFTFNNNKFAYLRSRMTELAVINNDFEMLEKIHSRELHDYGISFQYDNCYPSEACLDAIVNSCDKIIEYFSEDYDISSEKYISDTIIRCYIYYFVGELADYMLKSKSGKAEKVLNRILKHNQKVEKSIQNTISEHWKNGNWKPSVNEYEKAYEIANFINFSSDNKQVSYYCFLKANIIQITQSSSDRKISSIIESINEIYDRIMNLHNEITICGRKFNIDHKPETKVMVIKPKSCNDNINHQ